MKTLTIEIEGQDWSDLLEALAEIQTKVSDEYIEGWDRNHSGLYYFRVKVD